MSSFSKQITDPLKVPIAAVLQYAPEFVQVHYKRLVELLFWKKTRRNAGGDFYNGHMETAFTRVFGLDRKFFADKRILDIGCGPIGTLEWADHVLERVGADPLANDYVKLNRGLHKMKYVQANAENLPFDTGQFDIVSLFNSLDHVEDVSAAISEATRVIRPGGTVLLIVEVDHKPTITEPNMLDVSILDDFGSCRVERSDVYRIRGDHDVYASVFEAVNRQSEGEPGVLCARLTKTL